MSETILGIIDEQGQIREGGAVPDLNEADLHRLYRAMLFSRRVDERMTKLQRQGRIGFFVGSTGEEAAIVGSAFALEKQDWLVPCYREAAGAFVRGYPLYDFLCQVYGNSEDRMKGRQMPCHWGSAELRLTVVSSPVGSQIPHATGLAMAAKILGKPEVALTYFGDGATSTGDFHVACNFAGVFKAPVVFFCRNNRYAISVPVSKQTASLNLVSKAEGYGIEGVQVDGNDVLAVYAVTAQAVRRARSGEGPTLIEAMTYRQGAHSTSDDPRAYRSDEEVAEWVEKDPITRFRNYLLGRGLWSPERDEALEEEIREEIQTTLDRVEGFPPPDPATLFEDVFDVPTWHLEEQRASLLEALADPEES